MLISSQLRNTISKLGRKCRFNNHILLSIERSRAKVTSWCYHNNRCLSILSSHSNCIALYRLTTASKFSALSVRMASTWSMGPGTLEVPLSLFATNRQRLAEKLNPGQVVVLQGGEDINHYDTDVQYVFRQEAYFIWLSGVREPGCYFALDVSTGKGHLFVPRLPEEYEVWMGKLLSCGQFKNIYGVDEVHYVDEIRDVLKSLKPEVLLTLSGTNTDSGLTAKEAVFEGIDEFKVDNEILFPIIAELRVIKTPAEIEVMRYVCKISSDAHKQVMLHAKPGLMEYQCESVFLDHCYRVGGCRHVSYTCICGSGDNAATLHYGHAAAPNTKIIANGDMCLFDMGGNYAGYAADITCSFPANGKFTDDQKLIYEAVLFARDAVLREAKPGVLWTDMHLTANRAMLEHLKKGGLLKGDVEAMIENGVNGILQPHGLGHLLGLDVHDVGGYLAHCPPRPAGPLARLRTARRLLPAMLLTVEPGCYFIPRLLDGAKNNPSQSEFFNWPMVDKFRGFGGVRIEDDVLITEDGVENLTFVPRTVAEIEDFMANGANFK
ncbi:xaa-Pro dipeptidase isoform X2 [Ostrinia furnacalis]|uniref:xaa-Pro dipeptidase isoform X1 n=1 Tax=Ostrinia furnacalis TaxID=93504 RepID=UPI001040BFDD|nr:xaa-Pro dipeptidase isoform X1 [Ostrinia furnacalis]XP_028156507.1 xaa-Pro dipeptidase isoform X2 [Ostrinia furnacalis]